MKKFFIISILVLLCIFSSIPFTYASSTTVISLSDSKITVNGETISTDTNSGVYTGNLFDDLINIYDRTYCYCNQQQIT